jgi:hypothetical protein
MLVERPGLRSLLEATRLWPCREISAWRAEALALWVTVREVKVGYWYWPARREFRKISCGQSEKFS